jgi:hypothetical protein
MNKYLNKYSRLDEILDRPPRTREESRAALLSLRDWWQALRMTEVSVATVIRLQNQLFEDADRLFTEPKNRMNKHVLAALLPKYVPATTKNKRAAAKAKRKK